MIKENTIKDVINSFFNDEEKEIEDLKLYNLLVKTLLNIITYNSVALLQFKGNISIYIEELDFNVYYITLSDSTIYQYKENSQTKMSKDRVLYYLNYIGEIVSRI